MYQALLLNNEPSSLHFSSPRRQSKTMSRQKDFNKGTLLALSLRRYQDVNVSYTRYSGNNANTKRASIRKSLLGSCLKAERKVS